MDKTRQSRGDARRKARRTIRRRGRAKKSTHGRVDVYLPLLSSFPFFACPLPLLVPLYVVIHTTARTSLSVRSLLRSCLLFKLLSKRSSSCRPLYSCRHSYRHDADTPTASVKMSPPVRICRYFCICLYLSICIQAGGVHPWCVSRTTPRRSAGYDLSYEMDLRLPSLSVAKSSAVEVGRGRLISWPSRRKKFHERYLSPSLPLTDACHS